MICLTDQQAALVCGGALVNTNVPITTNVPINLSVGVGTTLASTLAVALGGSASSMTSQSMQIPTNQFTMISNR